MWPLAMEGGGADPNSGAPVMDSAGKGRGKECDSPVTGFWPELGRAQRRRTRAARPCGGSRRNGGFSGLAAKARRHMAWAITVGVCASASGLRGAGRYLARSSARERLWRPGRRHARVGTLQFPLL
jgi:hypothetical protein